MKKIICALLLLTFAAGCGPKAKLVEGTPERTSEAELWQKIKAAHLQFEDLRITGSGRFEGMGQSQSFRFEIRLLQDSILWVDLMDPFLGLRVARGILSRGELQYYNRLERNFFRGKPDELMRRFAFDFQFERIFPMLCANLLPSDFPYRVRYESNAYRLTDFDGQNPSPQPRESFTEIALSPNELRPHWQEIREPVNGKIYRARYSDYRDQRGFSFPQKIEFEYTQAEKSHLELNINKVERNSQINFPFNIPDAYKPLP